MRAGRKYVSTATIGAIAAIALVGAGFGAGPSNAADPGGQNDEHIDSWQWIESGRWLSKSRLGTLTSPEPMPDLVRVAATSVAPGLEHSQYDNGVVEADVLRADLNQTSLGLAYTTPGSIASRSAMTSQAKRTGAIAAVNGDFFDIDDSGAPRGVGVVDSVLLHAPLSGWNNAVAFNQAGSGNVGRLAKIVLDATVTPPSGTPLKPTNLNSPNVATNGIGIYTAAWGTVARSRTVDGATGVREVEIRAGVVTAVRTTPGTAVVPADGVVLLGRETGATALAALKVGDAVDVTYKPTYDAGDPAYLGITGNLVLLRDGVVTTTVHPRHPRTGVGFSADGRTMWLVALDGRTTASTGMTYVEFGNFMKSLGADDALNLDGGGSTTMVAKMPGEVELAVLNKPSDGMERPVPNGLGFTSTAYPPACVKANLDFASYASVSIGSTGNGVLVAECLLKVNSAFSGAPDTTFDAATETAVKAFQTGRGLTADGVVNAKAWTALLSSGAKPTLQNGSSGLAVSRLQRALTAALGRTVGIDRVFGPNTETAVRDYQRTRGLGVDGIVGPLTWGALQSGK